MTKGDQTGGKHTAKGWLLSTTIIAGLAALGSGPAFAEPGTAASAAEIQRIYERLAEQERTIAEQQGRIEALEAQINVATSPAAGQMPIPAVIRQPIVGQTEGPQGEGEMPRIRRVAETTQPNASTSGSTVGDAPDPERPEVAALVEEGGVLTRKGQLIVEPSFEYVRTDTNTAEVVGFSVLPGIVIGDIVITEADRDTIVSAITARYGVTNRFEVEAKVPFVYRDDTTTSRPTGSSTERTPVSADAADLGDIEVAAHYQINDGRNNWPFLIGNLRFKTDTGEDPFEVPRNADGEELSLPTGTGFYSLEPSITALLPTDPAVLFANVGYTWNIERNVGGAFGKIDPGDSIGASFGMGLGLNESLSVSLSYDHDYVTKSTQNGQSISNVLQIGRFTWGTSYRLSQDVSLNANVSMGVTEDAPDLDFLIRVPISFDLLGGG